MIVGQKLNNFFRHLFPVVLLLLPFGTLLLLILFIKHPKFLKNKND